MQSGILFSCQRELDERKVEDMKRTFFCGTLACAFLLLNACTFGDIQIETWSEALRDSAAVNSADSTDSTGSADSGSDSGSAKTLEAPRHAALGERFYAKSLVQPPRGSGEIYVTIDRAEVFATLAEAGIALEDTLPDSVVDGIQYDQASGTFRGDRVIVTLHFTVENVNATSPEHAWEPEFYEEYDFRADALGACTEGPNFYFSKHDACSAHYYAFHLEPGETTEFEASYLVNWSEIASDKDTALKHVQFETTYPVTLGTTVDLNLK